MVWKELKGYRSRSCCNLQLTWQAVVFLKLLAINFIFIYLFISIPGCELRSTAISAANNAVKDEKPKSKSNLKKIEFFRMSVASLQRKENEANNIFWTKNRYFIVKKLETVICHDKKINLQFIHTCIRRWEELKWK